MIVVLKYQDEEFISSNKPPPGLEDAVALLQQQIAHRRASTLMRQPAVPVKSARRPRPLEWRSSSSRSYSMTSSDGESSTTSSPTFPGMAPDSPVESIRQTLNPRMSPRQHSTHSSFSSTSSHPSSLKDYASSRRSSFDWSSLDTSIAALIEVGAKDNNERSAQMEHREAAQKYRHSRQLRLLSRQQKQYSSLH